MSAADRYRQEFGPETLERQQQAAKDYWPCCGEHRADGHHPECSLYRPDEPPAVHEDQESLL